MRVTVTLELNGAPVPVTLGEDAIAAIAAAVDARPAVEQPRWLYGARAAAAYLGWPIGRVQKLTASGRIPARKVGQRCTYRTDELDTWLAGGGA